MIELILNKKKKIALIFKFYLLLTNISVFICDFVSTSLFLFTISM